MRVLFAASSAIAIPALEILCKEEGIELAGILTNEDTPKGRHRELIPTEIGKAAAEMNLNIPILKPSKLDADAREKISCLKPDLLVSFAYGRIFGPKFLSLFPLGGINIHPSLLPKYRGPSPIQAAILNRDRVTGVTIQTLAEKMDTGDILAQEQIELTGRETTGSLSGNAAQKAASMLPQVLKEIAEGKSRPLPQNHDEASYCMLVKKEDGIINWEKSAAEIEAAVRAYDPWPFCRSFHKGRELLILESEVYLSDEAETGGKKPGFIFRMDKQKGILIQTGDGVLSVKKLQYQNKKALYWQDFLNGARDFIGSLLG